MVHDKEHVVPLNDEINQLGCKNVVFHFCELLHNLYFTHYFFETVRVAICIGDVLDRHRLFGGTTLGLNDVAERAFAQEFDDFVLEKYGLP